VFARVADRRLPAHHLPNDVDVLAGPRQGLAKGLAVPALYHLGARDAEAEDYTTLGEVVEGEGVHRSAGRRAGGELNDGSAELDALGLGADPGQGGEGIGAPGLGGPA
jgi:hypothetical protein